MCRRPNHLRHHPSHTRIGGWCPLYHSWGYGREDIILQGRRWNGRRRCTHCPPTSIYLVHQQGRFHLMELSIQTVNPWDQLTFTGPLCTHHRSPSPNASNDQVWLSAKKGRTHAQCPTAAEPNRWRMHMHGHHSRTEQSNATLTASTREVRGGRTPNHQQHTSVRWH